MEDELPVAQFGTGSRNVAERACALPLRTCEALPQAAPAVHRRGLVKKSTVHACTAETPGADSSLPPPRHPRRLDVTKGPLYGSPETAFLYALHSAGVAHTVARACATGQLKECACGSTDAAAHGAWRWGGCSDDVQVGMLHSAVPPSLQLLNPGPYVCLSLLVTTSL
ncbi:hypothetical protein HPB50_020133 [Hyalomma asiaticum]|uniref:Uncharacterized protein n=1 Tax=Hyalomma asiaticum TaxID=266040 RepID=A0ACB7S4G2_HYAAI|nr:hypothetical protein HPB50_020133 [Hyalomma asiaticum]